ncbi:5-(carboxyamino)imidazole ribonucleotide synthase [Paenibacillus sp. UNCCL117]|uniref:5-(carboxyamino)imidazole ribonucleotide synthase n=1 Tax=unclassified Paenibacillus TaxID=185978 RepID=UPI000884DCA9|nr:MULTISPECIES: 5-(carboxyamino)imidazole ribonucleotide synthase [unclassified Paenibacillus]SDE08793.1 5-(carboxyamino)imidazole ribonucleotide synthase [Paenibacillus sp. cl123]SFW58874.1 5-(carboxyamino)imidazole ribonucleotide synthase [Paenibacillus sp. UNCCL117]
MTANTKTEARAYDPSKVIAPGGTIGVLGGGQLGRMLALAGRAMGYRFATLDPTPDSPCGQVADEQIIAPYHDAAAARELAKLSDVITYEFENVDANVTDLLMKESYVPQGSSLLYTTQHRLREKRAIEAAGVKVAPYAEIRSADDLREAAGRFGLPCVLKTAMGGYDGKGQWVIRSEAEIDEAYETLAQSGTELVLEQFIRFEKELSVIAARSPRGEVKTFPAAENEHVNNILHLSIVPARVAADVVERAEKMAAAIAEGLDVIGLIAVELFLTADGELFVNELAPRPHNSGHYTMEACRTSQFEQHVRAICNLPLGDPGLMQPVVMVNVLGEHVQPLLDWIVRPESETVAPGVTAKLHLYGKAEAKNGRKMGHVNVLADTPEAAFRWIEASGVWTSKN